MFQRPHNEFVTKTYMTTYTYLTTFAQEGSTVVSSREKVVSNIVTEEIKPSKTKLKDHFTLTASPDLTTGVYHTTYTYLNTLVDGELPLVITSKKTVSNTVTEQPGFVQPSEVSLQDTNTYLSTVAYTKTLNEGNSMKIVSTEDVLTQVVITESDFLPSAIESIAIQPTPITTDIVKTYFATYTYYNTKVEDGQTIVNTEVVTSSDIATETFTIQPKRKPVEIAPERTEPTLENSATPTEPLNLFATKTYLTTFTYFTTLLQENKIPSTVVSSSTKVVQNVVTETVNASLLNSNYLNELRSSINDYQQPIVATATMDDGAKLEITAMDPSMIKATNKIDMIDVTSPSNIITGSTIIFFDESDEIDDNKEKSSDSTENTHFVIAEKAEDSIVTTDASSLESEETTNFPSFKEDSVSSASTMSSTANPVKNIFGNLGINGLNALGPVLNAMADLFQNKFSSGKKNTTKLPQSFKPVPDDIPRPVYVPALDSDVAESQNLEGQNIFVDTMQRTRQTDRTNIEAALLSGGIPISPGQVITTNSDVIIGKPAVHGPRPPINKIFDKEVEGMKPPPLPQKGLWSLRDHDRYPAHVIPQRNKPLEKFPPRREQFPAKVQPSISHKQHNKNNFIDLNHEGTEIKFPSTQVHLKPLEAALHSSKPIDIFQKPIPNGNKVSPEAHRNQRPTIKDRPNLLPAIYLDDTADLRPPAIQTLSPNEAYFKEQSVYSPLKAPQYNFENFDQPNKTVEDPAVIGDQISPKLPPAEPFSDQLFVNIQPSQVANVIIPHGAPTALIYNRDPEIPSQKGEIINDPSPYPDAEVGIGGVAGLIQPEDENVFHGAILPTNAVKMDIPVSPQGIGVDPFSRLHKEEKKNGEQYYKKPVHKSQQPFNSGVGLDYMTPPPPPSSSLVAEDINFHIGVKGELEDQEGEYSLKNEYQAEDGDFDEDLSEDMRIKHGLFFNRTHNEPSEDFGGIKVLPPPQHFSNYSGTSDGVSFSVINSKPVILGSDTTEIQAPIIKGKPGVSKFVNNSEATVSVGQMTNLKPNDELDIPSNPLYNVHSSAIIRKPQILGKQNRTNPKPFDNTVYTMNIDEKPPIPTFGHVPGLPFELPPPVEMDPIRHTSRPVFDRNSEVAGLTPPAIIRPHDPKIHLPTWRPPSRKRPPPPYKFELPVTSTDRTKKPLLPETEMPPPPPVPTEVLSPPNPIEAGYFTPHQKKTVPMEKNEIYKFSTTSSPESINPILGGSLKVEEISPKPEVITADSKVINSNPKISPDDNRNKLDSQLSENKLSPTYVKPNTLTASFTNELIIASETVVDDDISQSSTQALKVITRPTQLISSGSTTIFKDYHQKSSVFHIKPTRVVQSHRTIIPIHIKTENSTTEETSVKENEKDPITSESELKLSNIAYEPAPISPSPTIHVITHTHTTTVTTTESSIIHSKGQKPSTHTLIVTKTLTSTVLDTVTEVHTIVKPTNILSTVTTTIPQATTTVYPTISTQQPKTETKLEKNKIQFNDVQEIHKQLPDRTLLKEQKSGNHQHISNMNDNDSILVVMTDQNTNQKLNNFGSNLEPAPEIEGPNTEVNEVAPNVLLSGYLSQFHSQSECKPDCKATRNERCQKINNVLRCVCRPGFARMFPDQPCKRKYFV